MTLTGGYASDNPDAVAEVTQYLELQRAKMLPTSMGDIQHRFSNIPYGWREIDIAAVICSLISNRKVDLQYSGSVIQPLDKHIPDFLRKRTEIDKTIVTPHQIIPPPIPENSRKFLKEYFNTMDIPTDDDDLIAYVLDGFTAERDRFQSILNTYYTSGNYPDRAVVEQGVKLCSDVLSQKKDNVALLKRMLSLSDDFLDLAEDMTDVNSFFKDQKVIFDSAAKLVASMNAEGDYLQAEESATTSLRQISDILKMQKPYKQIPNLPNLIQNVQMVYGQLLDLKKQDVLSEIQAAMGEVHQAAEPTDPKHMEIVKKADAAFVAKKTGANEAESMIALDAMKVQIASLRQQYIKALMIPDAPTVKTATANRNSICYTTKLKNEAEIDQYVAEIKDKLMELLKGNDVLHII